MPPAGGRHRAVRPRRYQELDHRSWSRETRPVSRDSGDAHRWRRRFRDAARRILAEHASPAELGLSVALGVFVACTPFYGLQTLLALGAAWLLGLNRIAAVTAAQVSIAPVSPFLILGSIQAGELILHGRLLALGPTVWHGAGLVQTGRAVIAAWLVGGAAMGIVLGGLLGSAVFAVARRRQEGPRDRAGRAAFRRAVARYSGASHQVRCYARIKYAADPGYRRVIEALDSLADAGRRRVLDLGCGLGMLGVLVGETGLGVAIHGTDWDTRKLKWAAAAAEGLPGVTFAFMDLLAAPLPHADCVVLLDVLHYHAPEAQDALLERVADSLSPGGAILVREADAGRQRFVARAAERFAAFLGWHRTAGRFHYRSSEALGATLEHLGFQVRVVPAGNVLHRANVLVVATRGGTGPSALG